MKSLLTATALAAATLLAAPAALAQAWPDKPVKVIVGFAPGGAADQIARLVSTPLADALGQTVVVENRAGANGNVAGDAVAKSPADGYTLLLSSGGMVSVNPHLYARMAFDPAKDLVPVASAARIAVYLMARNGLEVNNIQEFIAYVKARPGKLSYGSPGNGSSPHLAGEMFKSQAGLFAVHVPYRGAAPALNDLLGNQIDYTFDPGIGLQHAKSGRLKLLAVGSSKRSPLFPNVPTLDEAGLKGFDADTVFGFYAPAGTPPAVIARLNTEINKILATPAVREKMISLGGEALPLSPAEFGKRGMDDSKRFGAVIKERKITAD
ncbi:tripartite tricarboxylate transporter substrate binding protein [Hydrogenophaga sp. YM1]|jgi:tripartite-type tricarboxylate transporter receptor subunit TctC|uniref:tripartite tricarboxylate transporter substrate binding protein n=1 Tax=Hydrogenophaga TaxID=47420 RepID=UPI000869B749|nr:MULTISPECIES: tripartite tricarboxylate transporter substrate binding protein [unclassified Hydrogenophaga]MBN9369578.1 tripartite tricarboxylate transporter substrate binding protein [Hydrogenophaga sp.]ODT33031.1 MAG: ABC transporter substrate-binding protein [Hydrogenophaga sp. SCN 70-13]OJV69730.1 MAG: ABC transporter substrate-binding protein [Hydrogenophaga sp. 70-12]QRR33169.1 tripartite tricarboxylate transporter substrate binding protein [Hydrogenophaga sp. YM1]